MVAWGAIIGAVASAASQAKQAEEGGTRSSNALTAPSNSFGLGVNASPVWALNIGGGGADPAIGQATVSPSLSSSATPFLSSSNAPFGGGSPGYSGASAFPVGASTLPGPAAGFDVGKFMSDPMVLAAIAGAVGLYFFAGSK